MLREIAPDDARQVMGLTGHHQFELGPDVRDPMGVVVSRIRKIKDDRGGGGGGGRGAPQRSASDSRSPGRQGRRPESRPQCDRRGPPPRARESRSRSPKGGGGKGSGGKGDPRQVFVAGIGDAPESKVRALFEEAGDIERLKFLTNGDGSSKGVCFVTYRTEGQADKSLDFHGEEFNGKKLIVRIAQAPKGGQGGQGPARRRDSRSPSPRGKGKGKKDNDPRQVFVSGIGDLPESKVRAYFEEIGDIERIKLLFTPEGDPKGVGFVTFRNEAQADKAVDSSGDDCCGRQLQIRYAN